MINYMELANDGERWELFARDFFESLGYTIENPPDRGSDDGKDLVISESIKGQFSSYKFRWLVSCKNFIQSGKSVNEKDDEQNLLERCQSFQADGFIGFYSTIASSGLNRRLQKLKERGNLKDYKIFDGQYIESIISNYGLSNLLFHYFPESYKQIRPLHKICSEFLELKCDYCGRNLFEDVENGSYNALIASLEKYDHGKTIIEDCYMACKGECNEKIEERCQQLGYGTPWRDLTDLANPIMYLHYTMCLINRLHDNNRYSYSEKALEKEKHLLMAMAQKVYHEVSKKEQQEFAELMQEGFL